MFDIRRVLGKTVVPIGHGPHVGSGASRTDQGRFFRFYSRALAFTYSSSSIRPQEKRLLAEVRDLMRDSLCRIEAQLKRNKLVKYKLEENWSDKSQSYKIDTINLGLNILSTDIMSHEDVVTVSEKYGCKNAFIVRFEVIHFYCT